MKHYTIDWPNIGVRAEISSFMPIGKTAEHHIILHVEPRGELFKDQLERLEAAEKLLTENESMHNAKKVFKRYFFSDVVNQAPLVNKTPECSLSFIQQPPLDGSKIAAWIYMQEADSVVCDNDSTIVENNGYKHIWKMGMAETSGNSFTQTANLLEDYERMLERHNATISENCIRTWFFVRDVDIQYRGMVEARKANFTCHGMTKGTHFIASTGIGGVPEDTRSILMLDTYAIKGFEPQQQRYLYAPTHLNPTSEYGVTFERGTKIEYGDRTHVYISGTASINNKGEVVHVGDIVNQTMRMWENVNTLLHEGGSSFNDVMAIIVYLRDICDYDTVDRMFKEKFLDTPYVITYAPVCRPQWLIEMECMAISSSQNSNYRDY